jgi:hypothetical protein
VRNSLKHRDEFRFIVPSRRTAVPYLKFDVVRKFFEGERKYLGSKIFGAPHFSLPPDELGQPDFAGSSRTSIPATRFDTAVPGSSVRAVQGTQILRKYLGFLEIPDTLESNLFQTSGFRRTLQSEHSVKI